MIRFAKRRHTQSRLKFLENKCFHFTETIKQFSVSSKKVEQHFTGIQHLADRIKVDYSELLCFKLQKL